MIIEHEFITRTAPDDAMDRADDFLFRIGFTPAKVPLIREGRFAYCHEYQRNSGTFLFQNITQLPQHLIIEYDRGRVTVACSIQLNSKSGGRSLLAFWTSEEKRYNRSIDPRHLLRGIVNGIQHAVNNENIADQSAKFDETEKRIQADGQQNGALIYTLLAVLLAILGLTLLGLIRNNFYGLFH